MGSSRRCSPVLAQFNVSSLSVKTKPLHEDLCPMRLSAPQPLLRKFEGLSLPYPFVFLTFEGVRTEPCVPFPAAFPGCLCFLSQRRCFRKQRGLQCHVPDVSQQILPPTFLLQGHMNRRQGKLKIPQGDKPCHCRPLSPCIRTLKFRRKALMCALKFLFEPKVMFRSSRN